MPRRLIVALALGGCSFGVTGPHPVRANDAPLHCTDDYILPVLDSAFVVVPLLLGVFNVAFTRASSSQWQGVEILIPLTSVNTVAAVWGYANVTACRHALDDARQHTRAIVDDAAAREDARTHARDRAWKLMQLAARAARDNGCTAVLTIDARIREVDLDFHDTVFVRDVAIARCLAPPVPAPEAPP